jgi:hypothetical protein
MQFSIDCVRTILSLLYLEVSYFAHTFWLGESPSALPSTYFTSFATEDYSTETKRNTAFLLTFEGRRLITLAYSEINYFSLLFHSLEVYL